MYYTTLNKIRGFDPCQDGWKKLLRNLGKTEPDDDPISLMAIFESNGLDDAVWCLRSVDGIEKDARLFAVWCCRQMQSLLTDDRSTNAIDVAERFANGQSTDEELESAYSAALQAFNDASTMAARDAAKTAANSAAKNDVLCDAVIAATKGSAVSLALFESAKAAANAKPKTSARSAARAVAWGETMQKAREAQKDEFRRMFGGPNV